MEYDTYLYDKNYPISVSYQVTKLPKIAKLPSYQVTAGVKNMKIKCEHYNSKNATFTCPTCRHYQRCTLLKPTNKNHTLLLQEINYWLKKLEQTNDNISEYETVFNDINNHKYSIPINVYGHIEYAPKTNAYGVFIKKPEHVIYGWNYGMLHEKKEKLMEHIRLLNRKELNMRRILERRR